MCPECLSLSSVSHYRLLACLFALMDQIEILPLQVTKTESNDAQAKVTLMMCQNHMTFFLFLSYFLSKVD